jgi:EAL domain-containing protein (putative c-di-GMP-specific phosphodiesterase class I)
MSNVKFKEFHHYYQPLYCLSTMKVYGYECLIRSEYFKNPEQLFKSAKKEKILHKLDMLSIIRAIVDYHKYIEKGAPLFINVFPTTLLHPLFQSFIIDLVSSTTLNPSYIVFEIVEEEVDLMALKDVVSALRRLGFRLAIDDVGKEASSLRSVIELQPHFVKLDRYFATDLSHSNLKQRMITSLVDYCQKDFCLVLEGIEHAEDLSIAKSLGVSMGQGYLLGIPGIIENAMETSLSNSL